MRTLTTTLNKARVRAFTLVEILVVVAIIALLVAVLMPALKKAKEASKATTCLSNLKQQGQGFAAYSKDYKQYLPVANSFRYYLLDGGYHNYWCERSLDSDWVKVNNGALYPRYTGNTLGLFFCASNTGATEKSKMSPNPPAPEQNDLLFKYHVDRPSRSYAGWVNPHNTNNCPVTAYDYALPAAPGKHPRDGTKDVYPNDTLHYSQCQDHPDLLGSPYYYYMNDPVLENNPDAKAFLGPIAPVGKRGKYPIQALLVDAYFGQGRGYHINGWNVLFSDYHAKRVGDAVKKIDNAAGSAFHYPPAGVPTGRDAELYIAWDYLSRNP